MKWLRCLLLGHIRIRHTHKTEIISYIDEVRFRITPGLTTWVECQRCKKQLTKKETKPYAWIDTRP